MSAMENSMEIDEKNFLNQVVFSDEEKIQLEQLERKRINFLSQELEKVRGDNEKLKLTQDIQGKEIRQIKEDLIKQGDKNNYALAKVNDYHLNLTGLGACHIPKIGSKSMGELLRKVGIARKDMGVTTPKSDYLTGKNELAISRAVDGHLSYNFHAKRTWKLIKSRLQTNNLLTDFENCKSTDDIHDFIKNMEFII
jgi:hypothetical protein